jgi:hypothetical protein
VGLTAAPEAERRAEPARERPAAPREREGAPAGPALAPGDLRLAGGAPPPPRGAGAASVLRLQRAVGNAHVQRALVAPGAAVQRQPEAPAAEATDYSLVLMIPGREPEQYRDVPREAALEALRGFRRQVLALVEGGREGHRYMTRVREDQYVVGFVSDVLGGFRSLPGMEIWQAPLADLALADAALAEGDVAATARLLKRAAAGWRAAQDQVAEYTEGTISGAGRAEVVLEVTAVLGGVAASLVTGGAASGLLLGTAYAATQTVARQGSELSLGMRDRIDWAGVTFDALFSLVTSKMGGKLGEGILKRLLARPEVASLGRRVLAESLSELLSGQAIASLHMAARTVFDNLRGAGAPVTVGQFLEQLGAHLTDPKSMFYDLLLGHVQRKLAGRAEASRAARRGAATPPPPEMESAALRAPDAAPDAPAALAAAGPEPASRTMAGSDAAPRPRPATGGGAEADPLHEMMAREGIRRDLAEPRADGPGLRPHTDYARGVGDPAEAYALYNRALGEAGGKQEVAIFRSERDGSYTVRVGDHGSVRSPSGEGWTAVLHFHPNRTAAERFFLPAPADFQDIAARRGDGGRTVREFIEFHVPGVGRGRAEYGADPSGDRPFYVTTHGPDGTTHTVRFRDVDEFRGYWESHHVAAAPGSELDAALRADVDAYLAGRRPDPAEGERTMAGDARGERRRERSREQEELRRLAAEDREMEADAGERPRRDQRREERRERRAEPENPLGAHSAGAKREAEELYAQARDRDFTHLSEREKVRMLDRYVRLLAASGDSQKRINALKGNFNEFLRTPRTAVESGYSQREFLDQSVRLDDQSRVRGHVARPDFSRPYTRRDGRVVQVHVNDKANDLHLMDRQQCLDTAGKNQSQAVKNARNLPAGEPIVLRYTYRPTDLEVETAMVARHFAAGSPVMQVQFGDRVYHNPAFPQ